MKRKSPSPKNKKTERDASNKKASKTNLKGSSKESLPKPIKTSVESFQKPKILKRMLNVSEFVKTIRRSTDLAHKLDWRLLTAEQ